MTQAFWGKNYRSAPDEKMPTKLGASQVLCLPGVRLKPRQVALTDDLFSRRYKPEEVACVFAAMASCPDHTFQVVVTDYLRLHGQMLWLRGHIDDAKSKYYEDFAKIEADCLDAGTPHPGRPPDPTWELRALYDLARRAGHDFPEHHWQPWPLKNVWVGGKATTQKEADYALGQIWQLEAAVRFLAVSPTESLALGECHDRLDWVTAFGGESPPHELWLLSIQEQCAAAGVPFHFGGWGAERPFTALDKPVQPWSRYRKQYEETGLVASGHSQGTYLLGGKVWDKYPVAKEI